VPNAFQVINIQVFNYQVLNTRVLNTGSLRLDQICIQPPDPRLKITTVYLTSVRL